MKRVLLTGMSGTGKSTVIEELAGLGFKAVDVDSPAYSEMVPAPEDELTGPGPGRDWVWQPQRVQELLATEDAEVLFIAGTSPNQGAFYSQFDHVILLSAPKEVILDRLRTRANNAFGKRPDEVERVLALIDEIEPRIRRGADHEIDTSAPLDQVVTEILTVVGLSA